MATAMIAETLLILNIPLRSHPKAEVTQRVPTVAILGEFVSSLHLKEEFPISKYKYTPLSNSFRQLWFCGGE
jgi:hypothetical protein